MENKKIDFQNVGDLCRRLKYGKVSRERFSLRHPLADIANGLYASCKAIVELEGGAFHRSEDALLHIREAAQWLINPSGKTGLMLMGMYGNGKTTLAKAIGRLVEFVTETENGSAGRKVIQFYKAKDICRRCKMQEAEPGAYRQPFADDMIILDELGEEPNETMIYGMPETPVADLLDHRYSRQKLTIVSTNLNSDELKEKYKGRLYDRFRQMFQTIVFENDSYRK